MLCGISKSMAGLWGKKKKKSVTGTISHHYHYLKHRIVDSGIYWLLQQLDLTTILISQPKGELIY